MWNFTSHSLFPFARQSSGVRVAGNGAVIRTLDVKAEGPVVCIAHFNTESASLLVYATQVRMGWWKTEMELGWREAWLISTIRITATVYYNYNFEIGVLRASNHFILFHTHYYYI